MARTRRRWRRLAPAFCGLLVAALPAAVIGAFGGATYQEEPINYLTTPADDPIARLQKKLAAGQAKLVYDSRHGYLRSLLQQLKVPSSSQLLVFSKTSFQHDKISPETPRALYFNDSVYVGWVQNGSVIELAATDPRLGAVFYTISQAKSLAPKFIRQTHECLQCHDSSMAAGVPGYVHRSVYPDRSGRPILPAGTFVTGAASPFSERWGGWYVTGTHGKQRHMGNVVARSESSAETTDWGAGANATNLKKWLDTAPYLTPHSDLVALMVAEHQSEVLNLITKANFETRRALHYQKALNKELGQPVGTLSESTKSRIEGAAETLARALLFAGEPRLTDPIAGTSGYAKHFVTLGPRDPRGRTLRELDLKTRLFRYPVSYMVTTEAFAELLSPAREAVYARLAAVLTTQQTGKDYANHSTSDRRAALEILREVHPAFAAWEAARRSS
jgi:hypothetical protein